MAFGRSYRDPALFKFSLNELTSNFGVKRENAHTELSDARAALDMQEAA